jgi:isopentenyl-diphosphate delta-isomerase
MWDLAGATHPLHIGKRNESYTEAAKRCAAEEWGVHGVKFKNMGGFNYFKKEGKNCENEFCAVLVGKYDGKLRPDPKAAYGFTWKPLPQIKADARKRPSSYVIWAVKSLPKIKL